MHLRSALALGVCAAVLPTSVAVAAPLGRAAAQQVPPAAVRPALRGLQPACGDSGSRMFPLRSKLHGGPVYYDAGGPPHTFALKLTNTTMTDCRDVHPLVVLVDHSKLLTPRQVRLEYADPASGAWRAVDFETSDDNENIGLPGGEGGPGFTVPARGALTVRLRLGFTADAARPDRVVVSATTMQRRGRDGAWVGESNHYTLDIRDSRAQLAGTGRREDVLLALGGVAWALMLGGTALVVVAKRRARKPRWPSPGFVANY